METQGDDEAVINPISFLKKRFADKLNEYYENTGVGIQIHIDDNGIKQLLLNLSVAEGMSVSFSAKRTWSINARLQSHKKIHKTPVNID